MKDYVMESNQIKPGYKTTEFWLTALAMLVSLLFASGIIPTDSSMDKLLGMVAAALGGAGYAVSRGLAKKANLVFCFVIASGFLIGCRTLESGAYKSLATLSASVKEAMSAFGEATDSGMVKAEDVEKVRILYTTYQKAMRIARTSIETYQSTKDKGALDQALTQVETVGAEIIRFVRELTQKESAQVENDDFNRALRTTGFAIPINAENDDSASAGVAQEKEQQQGLQRYFFRIIYDL
jgi:hypothetical protein